MYQVGGSIVGSTVLGGEIVAVNGSGQAAKVAGATLAVTGIAVSLLVVIAIALLVAGFVLRWYAGRAVTA